MKTYSYLEEPIKVFGVVDFEKKKQIKRLPDELLAKIPRLGEKLATRCPGARIGFRTNSTNVTVRIRLRAVGMNTDLSIRAGQAGHIFIGKDRQSAILYGTVMPTKGYIYEPSYAEGTVIKDPVMEEVLVWLPLNEVIEDVEVILDDDAVIEAPTPYKHPKPALYYGSSITEGQCGTVFNGYSAVICKHLDLDYYNFGFSGNAKADPNMAEYISTLDISVYVMDYDYNAETADYLKATHEPLYRFMRERRPDLPIIMMSRPCMVKSADDLRRRDIVYETYRNAVRDGDRIVRFVDGVNMFTDEDRPLCSMDTCHPNDFGFNMMAKAIIPVMKELLETTNQ